jgi:hypothetical protein
MNEISLNLIILFYIYFKTVKKKQKNLREKNNIFTEGEFDDQRVMLKYDDLDPPLTSHPPSDL